MTSHDDLDRLFQSAPVGILVADLGSTKFLGANPAICHLLGYSESELLQLGVDDICPPAHRTLSAVLFDARTHRELARSLDCPCLRKDRSVLYVDISTALISFRGRQAVVGFIADNTERRQAEAEKAKFEAQSRELQKAESLGRMAGAIAHHFNNRLQAVMGMLELALADLPRDADVLGALNAAMGSARDATKISTLMLAYLGQTPGKREPLDLAETCRHCLPVLRATIPMKVALTLDLSSPGPVVKADASQIQQLLANLITNAWEAIGDGHGSINVSVGTIAAAGIPTGHCVPGGWKPTDDAYACLKVTDSGCGISRQTRSMLFDPFFSSKFAGRGLGLPVVKGIATSHGGAVTVESEPEQGTTFAVYLPLLPTPARSHHPPTPPSLSLDDKTLPVATGGNGVQPAAGDCLELLG